MHKQCDEVKKLLVYHMTRVTDQNKIKKKRYLGKLNVKLETLTK